MPLGIKGNPLPVTNALNDAHRKGIIILASASNEGANDVIAFPARLEKVFCIGSADGKGGRSSFSPPFLGEEKYSALGEEVMGAWPLPNGGEAEVESRCRRSGTSTAVAVATGIVAFLIDYTRQFLPRGLVTDNWDNLRKIFLKMSEATIGESYRYLSPKYLFGSSQDVKSLIKSVIRRAPGAIVGYRLANLRTE
jgi:subtilisin family serine protease